MKNVIKMSVAAAVMMTVGSVSVQAADGINVFENVKVKGEIRPRYEMVDGDQTPAIGNANAVTNRLVLGVGADIAGSDMFSVYGEMTDVHALNPDNYNSTDNGNPNNKQVVADPGQTRVTQAYLDIKSNGFLLRSGRQMINLDNQRFVGAVGWRQMPQTYDGFLAAYSGVENLNLAAAYLTKVNRIKAGAADHLNTRTVVLHATYKAMDALTVTAYDYMLGSGTGDNTGAANGVGSDTIGIALTGKPKLGDGLTLNYRAEYAIMTDPTMDNSNIASTGVNDGYDANYYNLELGMNMGGILAGINYEVQSGMTNTEAAAYGAGTGDNKTFSTALGTNHKFNGWADVFLGTPTQGLEDLNLMIGYKSKQLGVLKAVYHEFTSAEENIDYGTEIDLLYKRAIPGVKNLTGMLKFADYSADDSAASGNPKATDVQKFWVMLDYKFSN